MAAILEVDHLQKYYGVRGSVTRAINDLSFTVDRGEFVGIMGASGSGKTTLLNCIATIDAPTAGRIAVEGKEITRLKSRELSRFRRERLGFVFQDANLLDTLTAFENIALALTIQKVPAAQVEPQVKETARLLDISECLNKYPYQLSGGQRQRTAAARAIITNPALILADEPTGALDSKSARLLLDRLEELNQELGATILMVTHDAFTASCCQRVVFLRDGQLYLELRRGGDSRKAFFQKIIQAVTGMGGGMADVL